MEAELASDTYFFIKTLEDGNCLKKRLCEYILSVSGMSTYNSPSVSGM
jgi:hypothetical protein